MLVKSMPYRISGPSSQASVLGNTHRSACEILNSYTKALAFCVKARSKNEISERSFLLSWKVRVETTVVALEADLGR